MWIDPVSFVVYRNHSQIRSAYPNISFPSSLLDENISNLNLFVVVPTNQPNYTPATHECIEADPICVDGHWMQQWTLIPRDIEEVRSALQIQRRERRNAAETGGFRYLDRRIDSDRDSVQRIAQAAALALQASLTNKPFTLSWTCADNAELVLDAARMLGLQAALAEHGAACHARSRTLRAAIEGAETLAELATVALEIETGWPE